MSAHWNRPRPTCCGGFVQEGAYVHAETCTRPTAAAAAATLFVVESRRPIGFGWSDWRTDEIGDNQPRSLAECERACETLPLLGHEWAEAEYRVRRESIDATDPVIKAETPITIHDDGKFIRTALVVSPTMPESGSNGSVDVVTPDGTRLCQINLFAYEDGSMIVDVIDVDERYKTRRAITFREGTRDMMDAGDLVSVDFRGASLAKTIKQAKKTARKIVKRMGKP